MKFLHVTKFLSSLSLFTTSALLLLAQPPSVILNDSPSRVLGQPSRAVPVQTIAPNWVEGRELTTPQGIAIDRSAGGPILYIADTGNNRVLAWRNPLAAANGAPADLIIGQRNRFLTGPNGPGTNYTTGLRVPTGLTVDGEGNLWVADSNNNRIMRYPKPFEQPADLLFPDVVLGQETFGGASSTTAGRLPNRGRDTCTANTLFLSDLGNNVFRTRMSFDPAGNLWVADPGNNRVLRFPSRVLTPGNFGPDADLVLGQIDFVTRTGNTTDLRDKSKLLFPSGVVYAADGRLYVSDGRSRVLVYRTPSTIGQNADRILGALILQQGQTPPPRVNDTQFNIPESLLLVDNFLFVADAGNNRVVRFNPADSWTPESPTSLSPNMRDVIGQDNFNTGEANRGAATATALGLNVPTDMAVLNNNLFIVDSDNNRVIVVPGGAPFTQPATKVFGQTLFDANSPNLIEGKEFFFIGTSTGQLFRGGGMAFDGNTLYIADTLNHRIMCYRDVRSTRLGQSADLIIGQVSPDRGIPNSPNGRLTQPNQEGLFLPHALAVDSNGDLWVADSGNARVLRFPKPFEATGPQRANLVLGQPNFSLRITDPSQRSMSFPSGLAFTTGGHLLVSDLAHNRVLYFLKPTGGDFTNFQAATNVFGQPDYTSASPSPAGNRMNGPRGIAVDVDDRMYVADSVNNRVHIYNRVTIAGPDASPALTLQGLNVPVGVHADPRTAEIWVANSGTTQAIRFPSFANLSVNPRANLVLTTAVGPLDIKVDSNSNVVVSDSSNRVSFYYQLAGQLNAANFQTTTLAPNTIASIFAQGGRFSDREAVFTGFPMPTELADLQVLLDEKPASLFFVGERQINFFVPADAPTSGLVEILVLRKSSGQVLASGTMQMNAQAPGFFTSTASGRGQVSAINEDGTVNSVQNPIARGQVISLYGTGLGRVSNAPPDGQPAPSSPLAEGARPDVSFNLLPARPDDVLYSGLAPGFVGLWQLNVRVPLTTPPGNQIPVVVLLNSQPNLQGAAITIAVKQ
jgi:uncharacterized protein (TIGR03437 family)